MKETKVQFSSAEMELMNNREIILTKNKVVEKIKSLLEELQNEIVEDIKDNPALSSTEIFSVNPKISKGENYLGLPYLILDYPRFFKQPDIFAIRTMFWWGNFFSTTLHLSGDFKLRYQKKIETSLVILSEDEYSIGINNNPWLHHFDQDNYKKIALLNEMTFRKECENAEHLKIAKIISLKEDGLTELLFKTWKQLTKICFD